MTKAVEGLADNAGSVHTFQEHLYILLTLSTCLTLPPFRETRSLDLLQRWGEGALLHS